MNQNLIDLRAKVERLETMQKVLPEKYEQAILAALAGGHGVDKAREIADDLYGRDFFAVSRELFHAKGELEAERQREYERREQRVRVVPDISTTTFTKPERQDTWSRLFGWFAG